MEVRSTTIHYSKKKRLKLKRKETEIQREIEELDRQLCNGQYLDQYILKKYESAKKELKDIYDLRGRKLCLDQNRDGLNMEKSQRNTFLI